VTVAAATLGYGRSLKRQLAGTPERTPRTTVRPTPAKSQASATLGYQATRNFGLAVSRRWQPAPMTGGSQGAIVKVRGGQPDRRVMETILAGRRHELIDRDELLVRDRRLTQFGVAEGGEDT
jgi:hypothetical protein